MHFVFDFGRVLFDWQPEALLQQVLPARVVDAASAAHWVAQVFQSYGGDWGEFDRGSVTPDELVRRVSGRTGLLPAEVLAVVDAVPASLQPIAASVDLLQRLQQPGRPMWRRRARRAGRRCCSAMRRRPRPTCARPAGGLPSDRISCKLGRAS